MKFIFGFFCIAVSISLQISFTQAQTISDSAKIAVQNKVNLFNQKIKENGYKWEAGVTSLSYLSHDEIKKLCNPNMDTVNLQNRLQREVDMYQQYRRENMQKKGVSKTQSIVNYWGCLYESNSGTGRPGLLGSSCVWCCRRSIAALFRLCRA
jgi:hypothetical protein